MYVAGGYYSSEEIVSLHHKRWNQWKQQQNPDSSTMQTRQDEFNLISAIQTELELLSETIPTLFICRYRSNSVSRWNPLRQFRVCGWINGNASVTDGCESKWKRPRARFSSSECCGCISLCLCAYPLICFDKSWICEQTQTAMAAWINRQLFIEKNHSRDWMTLVWTLDNLYSWSQSTLEPHLLHLVNNSARYAVLNASNAHKKIYKTHGRDRSQRATRPLSWCLFTLVS